MPREPGGKPHCDAQGLSDRLTPHARGLEVLSTPLDTYTTARKAAMINTNNALVARLEDYFARAGKDGDPPFFKRFTLTCSEEAPLGWSLTPRAGNRIDDAGYDEPS